MSLDTLQALLTTYGLKILGSVAIFVIGRWIALLLQRWFRHLLERAEVDATLVTFLGNLAYFGLLTVTIVAALSNLGIPTTSLVAILGAGTLAVGLALQDSLSSLASGLLLVVLRPYRVGDYVIIGGVEGRVTAIQIFHTTLLTRDKRTIFVPNKEAVGSKIINYSREEWIRLDLVFGIGYEDDLRLAKQILMEIVSSDDRIAQDPKPVVAVQELGDSSVNLAVQPYVRERDMVAVRFDITEQVKLRFDAAGISIPFPQRDVHLYQAN
ncbi:MAG: mechanosensitive ion channel family protein [Chloroflexi bacterium]|nr:MAG: mechanosensitive ion channel family protein [Chloroflexota bacterium]